MSGRSGYRKTTVKRAPRAVVWKPPAEWHLSFLLPDGRVLAPGTRTGVIGVSIGHGGWIEIVGGNRDWVIGQASKLCAEVIPYWRGRVLAHLIRAGGPGPTLSGPLRCGDAHVVELQLQGRAQTTVTEGGGMRQLRFAV